MPFHPVLEAFGGNLKIVGTGASTANQHMPHFADDASTHAKGDSGFRFDIRARSLLSSYTRECSMLLILG